MKSFFEREYFYLLPFIGHQKCVLTKNSVKLFKKISVLTNHWSRGHHFGGGFAKFFSFHFTTEEKEGDFSKNSEKIYSSLYAEKSGSFGPCLAKNSVFHYTEISKAFWGPSK